MMYKAWNIKRSDLRPRCGYCYGVFLKDQLQFRHPALRGYRFNKCHYGCREAVDKQFALLLTK